MSHDSLPHLLRHHRDFEAFRDVMIETAVGRFGPIWWGIWDQLVQPPAGATLLDLGTGPGMLLPQLRARHPDARILGVEVQPAMLEHARAEAAACRAEVVEADLSGPIPLPDGLADVVTAVHVLHELEYPPPLLAEAHRLLKPGGVLVLYDWVKQPLETYLDGGDTTEDAMEHFREHCLFTPEDLEFLVRRAGFTVRETLGRRGGRYAVIVATRA